MGVLVWQACVDCRRTNAVLFIRASADSSPRRHPSVCGLYFLVLRALLRLASFWSFWSFWLFWFCSKQKNGHRSTRFFSANILI